MKTRKKLSKALVLVALIATVTVWFAERNAKGVSTLSMALPAGSIWVIHRELDSGAPVAEHQIKITSGTAGRGPFTARYITTSNPSEFAGETVIREGEVLNLVQRDTGSGYYACHSGLRIGTTDTYKGRWYSDAGEAGDFKLYRIP